MPTVLVTGASQGLGLEFTRQYAGDGWTVIACCRNPGGADELRTLAATSPGIRVEALDICDPTGIRALATRYQDAAIDVLVNNAGLIGPFPLLANLHRQHFGSLDYELWGEVIATNTFGPVRVTEAFVEQVARSGQRKIAVLSSTTGSIAASDRQALAYTTSKAALNKAMALIAKAVAARGISVGIYCPGYVKTRMNVDGGATVEPADSVAGLRRLIATLGPADSGTFRRYNGESIPW